MSIIFSDTFTDTDGTQLASHTPPTGTSYTVIDYTILNAFTAQINTNRLRTISPGYNSFYRWKLNPISAYTANHTISFNFGANIGNNGAGDIRFQTRHQGNSERYEFRVVYNHSTSYTTVLAEIRYVNSGGTVTVLTSTTFSPSQYADEPFVCTVNGNALSMTRNGTSLLSTTDNTITTAGDLNLRISVNEFSDGARLDNLEIANIIPSSGGNTGGGNQIVFGSQFKPMVISQTGKPIVFI